MARRHPTAQRHPTLGQRWANARLSADSEVIRFVRGTPQPARARRRSRSVRDALSAVACVRTGVHLPTLRGNVRLCVMAPKEEQLGTVPLSVLVGRGSRSAEAALRRQIEAELAMTPRERVLLAIHLGATASRLSTSSETDQDAPSSPGR